MQSTHRSIGAAWFPREAPDPCSRRPFSGPRSVSGRHRDRCGIVIGRSRATAGGDNCNWNAATRKEEMVEFTLNEGTVQVDADLGTPLPWVLRDTLGMMGTKYGCVLAQCDTSTVHIDDYPALSCLTPIEAVPVGKLDHQLNDSVEPGIILLVIVKKLRVTDIIHRR